jgi:hypothetical protein
MDAAITEITGGEVTFERGPEVKYITKTESGKRTLLKAEPLAAVMLAPGLVFAVAADGELPAVGMKALFAVLFVLDIVMIHWLTRSRGA